jgi:predicted DNA-binding protein with PD1-like motif
MKPFKILRLFIVLFVQEANAQDFVSPTQAVDTGRAPGLKVKLLSKKGRAQTYVLIFSPGDEVRSGLNKFAQQYHVKSAHYTAVGDVTSANVGFYDYERKMFKVIPIDTSEVVSFAGNVTMYDGNPTSHTHVCLALKDGSVKGGHLLELFIGPTLEVFVTVEPTPLFKKLDKRYNAAVINPALDE